MPNNQSNIYIPLTVPKEALNEYSENYKKLTFNKDKLIMFAGDQHVEHDSSTFIGSNIANDDISPEHLFKIASKAKVSALATQYGYISQYAKDYSNINLIVKLNSISKFLKKGYGYQASKAWVSVKDVIALKKRENLNILGVGYTVYVGIKDESLMYKEASKIINEAHKNGLVAILWVYPKGKGVKDETFSDTIITACSIGSSLGADFIKVNSPDDSKNLNNLKNAVKAAGKSKVIISGGSSIDPEDFLRQTSEELQYAKTSGVAVGRNIHQKSVDEAVKFSNALYDLIIMGIDINKIIEKYYKDSDKSDINEDNKTKISQIV